MSAVFTEGLQRKLSCKDILSFLPGMTMSDAISLFLSFHNKNTARLLQLFQIFKWG